MGLSRILFVAVAFAWLAAPLHGQPQQLPLTYAWIATPCADWNCAVSTLALAAGDKYVYALPTSSEKYTWVVVRRIVAGSVYISPDNPFDVEAFDTMAGATDCYGRLTADRAPILLTANGGKNLVIALKPESRRRIALH